MHYKKRREALACKFQQYPSGSLNWNGKGGGPGMKIIIIVVGIILITLGCATVPTSSSVPSEPKPSATGQANWPATINNLLPGESNSPVAAYLPANTKIIPPAIGLPPEKAVWSGKWRGWADRDRKGDARLVVEQVTDDGAKIIYSYASNTIKPFVRRMQAKFVGNELQADIDANVRVFYRMRPDGDVEFLWRKGETWVAGILSKEKSKEK